MTNRCTALVIGAMLTGMILSVGATAQETAARVPYPPAFPDAKAEVYKTVDGVKLNLYIFRPSPFKTKRHAAIIFFFGGAWRGGSPAQFEAQCRRLAALGMIAITADYRVSSRNHSTAADSVRDAKSAIRYVRANAARLGIDPRRIAAAGGSAGGHIAAAAGAIEGLDEPSENKSVSSRPNALVLFNPIAVLAPLGDDDPGTSRFFAALPTLPEFKGVDLRSISPAHHIGKTAPPTIVFHGKADTTVPYSTTEQFARRMQAAGVRCELFGYDGQNHGFFNKGRDGDKYYEETMQETEKFLRSIRFIRAPYLR